MTYTYKIEQSGDRIVYTDDSNPHCRVCLKTLVDGEVVHFCTELKNVMCDEKECKGSICNTFTPYHEDWFGVLKIVRGKKNETRKETSGEFDEVASVFEL